MIESVIRPFFQRYCCDPVARGLAKINGMTPNVITVTSIVLGIFSAIFLVCDWRIVAVIMLLLSGYGDVLDGTMARLTGHVSNIGAMLDIVGDRIVEFVIMFAIYCLSPHQFALPIILMLGSSYLCVTTFLVVGIFSENQSAKSFHYSAGLMERAEAFAFFIVMMLFPITVPVLAWVYFVLVLYTAIRRMVEYMKQLQGYHGAV